MAGNLGQNASVEEILASIRQAISSDDGRRSQEHYRSNLRALTGRRAPIVEPIDTEAEGGDNMIAAVPEVGPNEMDPDQDFIEHAIEQALDGVRAELEASKPSFVRPLRSHKAEDVAVGGASRSVPRSRLASRTEPLPVRRSLMSPQAGANVSGSFDELAKAMMGGNARKLDEVVAELLRPMLKTWLEGNLPQMVERMVREEIERVSRGRR
jgi:uncharacterized protein